MKMNLFLLHLTLLLLPIICIGLPQAIPIKEPPPLRDEEPKPVNPSQIDDVIRQFALSTLETGSSGTNARRIVRITNASVQVVQGNLYTFTMELANTDCPRPTTMGQKVDENKCKAKPGGPTEVCTVSVWSKPLENNALKLTKEECKKA